MLLYIPNSIKLNGKVLSTLVLGTFVFFSVFALSGCEGNSLAEIDSLNIASEELPISTSNNVVLQYSDSGNVKIILRAPVLEKYKNLGEAPYDLLPEGLVIEFIDSIGEVEAKVMSKYAVHYPKKELLILSNDVQIFNIDGDKLNSEYMTWDARTKKIKSDDFVKITTADEIIYGDGFEANQDFTNYKINHIKGIIAIEDESIQ
jgi:LPS export ABC transporter protein LptC